MESYDVAVIGGGLLGCFAARALCRLKLNIVLIEAREDVCTGISRANTAVVYPGYDHKPGTLKAGMTVRANATFAQLCRELDVPFSRCGSLMLSFGLRADAVLRKKLLHGRENRVPELRLLSGEEAYRLEPSIAPGLRSALWSPAAGTVNPWQLGIAAAENARQNGTEFLLNTRLLGMRAERDGYLLETDRGELRVRAVVNCAGLAADRVQDLLFPTPVRIVPTAGDYLVLDRSAAGRPAHILEYEPEGEQKGLTFVPTVEGSLLIGPTERENSGDFAASAEGLLSVRELAGRILPALDRDAVIRSFAAVRPNPQRPDGSSIHSFVIEHPGKGFWSLIGIKTPGLTCAAELGLHVAEQLARELGAEPNPAFDPVRVGIRRLRDMPFEARKQLVEEDPDYGEIVCFCEEISKAEVLEAIRRGALTVDGVKRRVGTGMGRCQGARCQQKIMSLLSRELGTPESGIRKDGPGSRIAEAAP
ncbi:MAG: NAD(P)/FAD-dependent oxidoreductase [Oscillospiraceae bacterium]|nr:NAD(P)/FAD-dependent oxidoreductase [Oscillospiraceae bacterium]